MLPVIPALKRQRQENQKFKISLIYTVPGQLEIQSKTVSKTKSDMVVHTCNPSIQEAEARV